MELAEIKQQVISAAVRENVDVMRGRFRLPKRTKRERIYKTARMIFLLALPIALFLSSYLVSRTAEGWINLQGAELAERVVTDARTSGNPRSWPPVLEVPGRSPDATAQEAPLTLSSVAALDRTVFPLAVHKIILDPGHGGDNRGTVSPDGLVEKTIALDISERVGALLEKADFEVSLTRTEDEFISLEERAEIANGNEGDLFVSVHLNWLETRQVRGIETYYLGPTDDPFLIELSATENRDSGYSIADYRNMLDRVFADVRQDESKKLARSVQRSLYNSLRRVNPALQDRGVKKAPFIVLTGTEMPAILAEVSCLSNKEEARLLMTEEYRQYIAEALSHGIEDYARELNKTSLRGT